MRYWKLLSCVSALALAACTAPHCNTGANRDEYKLVQTVSIGGTGVWDYVRVDKDKRRVYVTHTDQVEVLNADTGKPVGVIDGLHGVHGVALSHGLGRGFITNGKSNSVTIFDLNTLDIIGEVKVGKKPDSDASDDLTHRLLAFNGESNSATVIDEVSGKRIGTIKLGASPEFAISDDEGHVFVNLEDTNETLMLDVVKLKVMKRWRTGPGEAPSSLALDKQNHRLFIGCRNQKLVVMNAESGEIIAALPIGDHVDATMYDPELHNVISSTGDGKLTVVKQDDADHYHVAQTILTRKGSRTFGLDRKSHRLFVPAADFAPAPATATPDNLKRRPSVIDGSFTVLIYDK